MRNDVHDCPVGALAAEARRLLVELEAHGGVGKAAGVLERRLEELEQQALTLQARSMGGALFQLHLLYTRGDRILCGGKRELSEAAEAELQRGIQSVLSHLEPKPDPVLRGYYVGEPPPLPSGGVFDARQALAVLARAGVAVSPQGFTFPEGPTPLAVETLAKVATPERALAILSASRSTG